MSWTSTVIKFVSWLNPRGSFPAGFLSFFFFYNFNLTFNFSAIWSCISSSLFIYYLNNSGNTLLKAPVFDTALSFVDFWLFQFWHFCGSSSGLVSFSRTAQPSIAYLQSASVNTSVFVSFINITFKSFWLWIDVLGLVLLCCSFCHSTGMCLGLMRIIKMF